MSCASLKGCTNPIRVLCVLRGCLQDETTNKAKYTNAETVRAACGQFLIATLFVCFLTTPLAADNSATSVIDYNRDVRPILADACYACHGPDEKQRKADLRLDNRAGILATHDAGLVSPSDPDESELYQRITSDDKDVRMPPGDAEALTETQIAIIRRWIEQGGRWQQHWAYVPPARPDLPGAAADGGQIDRFLQAEIDKAGLEPVETADPRTLIRRLSLDLVGLPPTVAEVESFVARSDANVAYEQLVDRLLASPHFGERFALYWLDLVRYADSVGYHKDSHRDVWLYRDYVIDALNENKPFDQFVVEQLAGDLLKGSQYERYQWQVASGFNRMNQTTSEGGAIAKQYLAIYAADRVRNTAAILLGSTMGCAECHDHKYDPFTTRDFYNFAAFFADLQEKGVAFPKQVSLPTQQQMVDLKRLNRKLKQLQTMLESAEQPALTGTTDRTAFSDRVRSLKEQAEKVVDPKNWPRTIISEPGKPRTTRLLPRGNWLDESGPVVEPAIPVFLGSLPVLEHRATRLDLAQWIVSEQNPLTARVFVNRLWRMLFGNGLCRTVDDLGSQGEMPSHPKLLDWLAVEFIESGWDIKHMVKLMAMSDAYRRSSTATAEQIERDPENRYMARQSSFRLDAELVRDNALAISGLLSRKLGGRSVKPYQPANYWYRLYIQGEYAQDHGDDLYRRGLYTYWRRSFWHPSLQAFDAPSREECVTNRPRSNTAQQSLVLLNDPTYVEAARVLAERMMMEGNETVADRIDWAYRRALARPPSKPEAKVLGELYQTQLARFTKNAKAATQLISVGEHPVPKNIPAQDLAAWTSVARAILNLHETITRN